MKSLEKLRGFNPLTGSWEYYNAPIINGIADEIEREIAEHYMELPVDADGVPIHVGDKMELSHGRVGTVVAVSDTQFTAHVQVRAEKPVCQANLHHHVKPRTLFDVLAEVENGELSIDDAAAEIRELLESEGE